MLYQPFTTRLALLGILIGLFAAPGIAQTDQADPITPIYTTVRVFQLSAPHGQSTPSDQVFRVSSANYSDEAKWIESLKKTYPGFTPALLMTATPRVFRTSKPQIVKLGQLGPGSLDLLLNGAQSVGDGTTPGTSFIAEVTSGQGGTAFPITMSMQTIEVESGKTYFYAMRSLKLSGDTYVNLLRRVAPASRYANEDVYLLFAFSIELDKPAVTARVLGERDSAALQNEATKKVQPVIPPALQQGGLSGKVQVRVEIAPTGKITKAITQTSNFPEMNEAVLAAARQWEFAPTLFAEKKEPISGLLSFEFPATGK